MGTQMNVSEISRHFVFMYLTQLSIVLLNRQKREGLLLECLIFFFFFRRLGMVDSNE